MPQFRYKALNADNQPVAGEILADSVAQAIGRLEAGGLTVQSIGYATADRVATPPSILTSHVPTLSSTERAELETRLIRIAERARELAPALTALAAELPRSRSRGELLDFIQTVESSDVTQATVALERKPAQWIPLLGSVSSSSNHGAMLQAIIGEYEPPPASWRPGRGWLLYPLALVCLAAVVFGFIGIYVVPVFRDLFAGFGLRLPELTQFVLAFYAFFTNGTLLVLLGFCAVAALLVSQAFAPRRSNKAAGRFAQPQSRVLAIATFSRYLADLIESGFQPATAMKLASAAIPNLRPRQAAAHAASQIESADELSSLGDRKIITSSVLAIMRADFSPSAKAAALREISHCHAERNKYVWDWTHGLIEPISILAVGFLIALTVIGLYLPLFTLLHSLT